jgi:rod shape-determining protein MreC
VPFTDRIIRRRVVLGALLLVSLGLLTAYFREAEAGPVHGAQRAANQIAAPFAAAVQRVVRPFHDAWSWTSGLVTAREDVADLRAQNAALQAQIGLQQQEIERNARVAAEAGFVNSSGNANIFAQFRPVGATVITHSPLITSSHIGIHVGSNQGVRPNDPVVAGKGFLVGRVGAVSPGSAEVVLINDSSMAVSAKVNGRGANGVVKVSSGDPGTLVMQYVQPSRIVNAGDNVATSGQRAPGDLTSHYPDGLLIGQVTSVSQPESDLYKSIQVTPFADLSTLSSVIVLVPKGRP